ncbi:MAG: hypothetical protein VXY09_03425 [Bacteroidota bacterium]|nr:hypothetical protein [Bacteroidota bacterium]
MRYFINSFKFLLFALIIFSCEERVELDYVEFTPGSLADNDGKIIYSDVDVYPVLDVISTDTPSVDNSINTGLVFNIDTVKAPAESTFDYSKFTIDKPSGVISYDNSMGGLTEGNYSISLSVDNAGGVARYDDVVTISVLSVPIQINIDSESVDVGSLQIGEIATASVTDLSGQGVVSMVTYQLVDASDIYSINETTGVISKDKAANSGSVKLSVQVGSNLGAVVASDLLTVNVGPSPTISLLQLDGSTPLTRVTLSPYTAYTSYPPVLSDMTAASWDIILPPTLDNFKNFFSMGAAGEITIAADANLPEGDYKIGVTPKNAGGISLDFPEVLTIKIENRSAVVFEDLINDHPGEDDSAAPSAVNGWSSHLISGTKDDGSSWKKMKAVAGKWGSMRRWMGGSYVGDSDECVIREIDLSSIDKTKPTTVVFGEVIGYGPAYMNKYDRAFYYGEDITNVSSGSWNDAEWVPFNGLGLEGADWLGANWNAGNGPPQDYTKTINLNSISGDKVYLNWRMRRKDSQTGKQNGQWVINDIRIEQPDVYAAEEE